jgi:hypothetical protein
MVLLEDVITKFTESIYWIESCQKPSKNRNFLITVKYVSSTEITVYMSWVSLPKGLLSANLSGIEGIHLFSNAGSGEHVPAISVADLPRNVRNNFRISMS